MAPTTRSNVTRDFSRESETQAVEHDKEAPLRPVEEATTFSLALIYVSVALYAAAFQAQMPVQPAHVKTLSQDAVASYTALRTFFSVLQLVGSLVSGALIDRFGAKKVLIISLLASALCYGITARATTLALLFLAQLPAVLQHAVLAARAYATIVVPPGPTRAAALGRVSLAYGVGMLIGPVTGGYLASISLLYAATAATVVSLLSAALVWAYLPETSAAAPSGGKGDAPAAPAAPTPSMGYGVLLSLPRVPAALGVKTLIAVAVAIFHSTFALLTAEPFGLDTARMGQLMSWVGGCSMFASALLVAPAAALSPTAALLLPGAVLAASLFAFALVSTPQQLFAIAVPQALSMTVLSTVSGAQMSAMAPPLLQGSLNAADMAIGSAVRIASPAIAAWLFASVGFWSVGASTGGVMTVVCVLLACGVGVGAESVATVGGKAS